MTNFPEDINIVQNRRVTESTLTYGLWLEQIKHIRERRTFFFITACERHAFAWTNDGDSSNICGLRFFYSEILAPLRFTVKKFDWTSLTTH